MEWVVGCGLSIILLVCGVLLVIYQRNMSFGVFLVLGLVFTFLLILSTVFVLISYVYMCSNKGIEK